MRTQNMTIYRDLKTMKEIEAISRDIDEHDCHLTDRGEDSCACILSRARLQELTGKIMVDPDPSDGDEAEEHHA